MSRLFNSSSQLVLASVLALSIALLNLVYLVEAQSDPINSTCLSGAQPFQLSTTCAPGFYCPHYNASNPVTFPVQCAPTNECMLDRLSGDWCVPQGFYEPLICEEGYYCPTPQEQLECPSGYICPRGQFEPIACSATSSCPSGSTNPLDLSGLIAFLVVDISLIILWYTAMAWRRRSRALRDATYTEIQEASVIASLYKKGAAYEQLPSHSKLLCQGFKRAQSTLPVMRLEFDNLSLSLPSTNGVPGKTILKGVTGSVEPGKVTAVMGPSGAGKTTFLNTMLGKVDSTWTRGGSLKINGVEESLDRFRQIIGYVPQEDIMHRDLSVYDNISYSANVRLPRSWTRKQREDHINATVAAMQLKHVQDTPIGDEMTRGISGGQRKRCNIGLEVAAAPSLLLLDEPTSGLDSTAAMEICQVLKDLARVSSLTVAMVIHQPRIEIWNQLDELLLLAPGGLTVYQGPQRCAVAYFQQRFDVEFAPSDNPADALMDRIAEQANEFVEAWKNGGPETVARLRTVVVGWNEPPLVIPEEEEEQLDHHRDAQDDTKYHSALSSVVPHVPLSSQTEGSDSVVIRVNPKMTSSIDKIVLLNPTQKQSLGHYQSSHLPLPEAFDSTGSLRKTASFLTQLRLAFTRSLWKQSANLNAFFLEVGLGAFAGLAMGTLISAKFQGILKPPYTLLSPTPFDTLVGQLVNNFGLAISLAAISAGVAVFGEEQVQYHREVAAGHNHLAYYLGVNLAQFPRLFVDAIHFAFLFHVFNKPLTGFGDFLVVVFFLFSTIYGLAFIVSMIVSRKNAPLLGVVASLLLSSMTAKGGFPEPIQFLSASRWAAEAIFTLETKPFRLTMTIEDTADRLGYRLDRVGADITLMFILTILYRVIAYIAMRWVDRKIITK